MLFSSAFEELGFNMSTSQRLSTERPPHLSLLGIAQIYVEDIFSYDLLLLSGGLPDFPSTKVEDKTYYWSTYKQGDKKRKFQCINFENHCRPEEIQRLLGGVDNDASEKDPTEG